VALFVSTRGAECLLSWLALSGGACLLERLIQEPVLMQTMQQPTRGDTNYVLRSETLATADQSGADIDDGFSRPASHVQQ